MNQKISKKNKAVSGNKKAHSKGKKPMKKQENNTQPKEESMETSEEFQQQNFENSIDQNDVNSNKNPDEGSDGGVAEEEIKVEVLESQEGDVEENKEEKLQKELDAQKEQYLRLLAEFENFKKRSTAESQTRLKYANQSLVSELINGMDNLERAVKHADVEDASAFGEFIKGVEMVQQQLFDGLTKFNIIRIYPKGEKFDPNQHEAVGVVESESVEPDHVAEVFQAGYLIHDRVIRPAMVQVVKK